MPLALSRPFARPRRFVALALLVGLALTFMPSVAEAEPVTETRLGGLVNGARVSAGLPKLTNHPGLADQARRHAANMAAQNRLYHSTNLSGVVAAVVPDWSFAGENVGKGGSVDAIHAAHMASSAHRANILDGRFNLLGVGTAPVPGGWIVAELFAAGSPVGLVFTSSQLAYLNLIAYLATVPPPEGGAGPVVLGTTAAPDDEPEPPRSERASSAPAMVRAASVVAEGEHRNHGQAVKAAVHAEGKPGKKK
jgi:hypothetical protein